MLRMEDVLYEKVISLRAGVRTLRRNEFTHRDFDGVSKDTSILNGVHHDWEKGWPGPSGEIPLSLTLSLTASKISIA